MSVSNSYLAWGTGIWLTIEWLTILTMCKNNKPIVLRAKFPSREIKTPEQFIAQQQSARSVS